jgi:uncharacterized protein (DUF1330 family)
MAADTKVRFIAHFTVTNPDEYRIYEKGFFPILRSHGGRFLMYDDAPTVLEGTYEQGRTVVLEFDSEEALNTWWNSAEYRELAVHRHAGTTTHSVTVLHSPPGR